MNTETWLASQLDIIIEHATVECYNDIYHYSTLLKTLLILKGKEND